MLIQPLGLFSYYSFCEEISSSFQFLALSTPERLFCMNFFSNPFISFIPQLYLYNMYVPMHFPFYASRLRCRLIKLHSTKLLLNVLIPHEEPLNPKRDSNPNDLNRLRRRRSLRLGLIAFHKISRDIIIINSTHPYRLKYTYREHSFMQKTTLPKSGRQCYHKSPSLVIFKIKYLLEHAKH